MPGAPSSVLVATIKALLLGALLLIASLLLVGMPGAPSSVLVTSSKALLLGALLLIASLLPSRDARSP